MKRVHISVKGRVQGVYYRQNTRIVAVELGLTGWVRNLPDGSVEILADGSEEKLNALIAWCKNGPPGSRVDHADINWEKCDGDFETFQIRY